MPSASSLGRCKSDQSTVFGRKKCSFSGPGWARNRKSRNLCTEMCFRMECFNSHFISRKWHYYFYSVFYERWGFSFDIPLCFISFHLSHHFRGVLLFLRCLTGKWMVDALNYTAITWLQTESTNTTSVALDSFVISCQSKLSILPFCCKCVSCETSLKLRLFRRPLQIMHQDTERALVVLQFISYIPSWDLKKRSQQK